MLGGGAGDEASQTGRHSWFCHLALCSGKDIAAGVAVALLHLHVRSAYSALGLKEDAGWCE